MGILASRICLTGVATGAMGYVLFLSKYVQEGLPVLLHSRSIGAVTGLCPGFLLGALLQLVNSIDPMSVVRAACCKLVSFLITRGPDCDILVSRWDRSVSTDLEAGSKLQVNSDKLIATYFSRNICQCHVCT